MFSQIALFTVAIAVATASTAAAAHTQNDISLQQVNDTLFLAGPEPVEWARDEPIQQTLDTMMSLMMQQSAPTRELLNTRALVWGIFGRYSCLPTVREDMDQIRGILLNEPRRQELYEGAGLPVPETLRLDPLIENVVQVRLEACKAQS